ncbi:MAG: penicillin acylase family protein, partial [Opitutales bacterium]
RLDTDRDLLPGSNSFAVDGAHTTTGAALLANDMHLGLSVPTIWYRAVLEWTDGTGPHRVAGVTLPGMPAIVAGSNGRIAWGFTNSYIDTSDVILAETDTIAQNQYRTLQGFVDFEERTESIAVKGGKPVTFTTRWSKWGPVIAGPEEGRYLVLNWNAHYPEATNLGLRALETATSVAEAVAVGHAAGMPNQNLLVADSAGHIAWTVTGLIPRRIGFDGRLPVSWAYGDRHWDGWLPAADIPVIADPADGLLWTANNRIVGGAALAKLGNGGYDDGARAGAIRDDLRALTAGGKKAAPADLLAIQLDDRARYMDRWQQLLVSVLSDEAVARKPARGGLRSLVRAWNGHAGTAAAYRLIRAFRTHVHERVLAPFAEAGESHFEGFSFGRLHSETAVWRLITEKPIRLLNPASPSWDSLLLAAADDVLAEAGQAGGSLADFTWGARNTLRMQHPFSRFLPGFLAGFLNMPAVPLPGDSRMPRVQGPGFGASERMVVSPGHEAEGILEMPGGQSGHPLSPFYRAGHEAWVRGEPSPFLPGPGQHTLLLTP